MIEQILGWIGNILFVYGVWILGNKNIKGFYINSIANMLYAIQSLFMKNFSLFWLSIFLIIINIIGIYKWKSKIENITLKSNRILTIKNLWGKNV